MKKDINIKKKLLKQIAKKDYEKKILEIELSFCSNDNKNENTIGFKIDKK